MKKRMSFFSAIVLTAMTVMLSACGGTQTQKAGQNSSAQNAGEMQSASGGNQSSVGTDKDTAKKLQIVTTIFPEYDWAKNILGKNPAGVEMTMLLNNGVDLHSYQPTADDILKISTCDLFVYVGGESDTWVKDALKEATNKNMEVMNLLETPMTTTEIRKMQRITTIRSRRITMLMRMRRIPRLVKWNMTSMSGFLCAMQKHW